VDDRRDTLLRVRALALAALAGLPGPPRPRPAARASLVPRRDDYAWLLARGVKPDLARRVVEVCDRLPTATSAVPAAEPRAQLRRAALR
jgi:hypothetical protein